MRRKKLWALTMTGLLLAGQTMTVFAGEGSGSGTNEGKKPDYPAVGSITFPTAPANGDAYNYIVDPNNLITLVTGDGHYGSDAEFETGASMFFYNGVENSKKQYKSTSESVEVQNESARDILVNVKVTADETGDTGVTFSQSDTFTGTNKQLYIAATGTQQDADGNSLGSVSNLAIKAIKGLGAANQANLEFTLKGNKENYKLIYQKSGDKGEYKYTEKGSTGLVWSKAAFHLVGACNKAANTGWENEKLPGIKVTWSWTDPTAAATTASILSGATAVATGSDDATAGYTHTVNYAGGTATNITLSLPEGQTIKTVKSGGSITGTSVNENNAKVSTTDSKVVTIPADSAWAATSQSGRTKVIVIEVGTADETTATFVVKVAIQ